ncbi:MAG: hypothetical protein ACHP7N_14730 [Caulobacterales bacterium]
MDRSRRRPRLLIARRAVGLLAVGLTAAAAPVAPPLRAIRWVAPGADAAQVLTSRPTECLGAGRSAQEAYEIELGRAAFRTPLLLGGQAARAGIACESCHRSGRNNPDFDFPGVSGAPGTADVTTSVLSSHRGDGIDNPKPIPNLSGPKLALKVDQDPATGKLEAFIDGIVTQEFDGAPPPPAALKGLAAYVRALSPASCPAAASEPVTAASDLADARRAVRAATGALQRGDGPTAILMLEAARSRLGDVNERYQGPDLAAQRQAIAVAALGLAAAEATIRRSPDAAAQPLALWLARSGEWAQVVEGAQTRSLYDRRRLSEAGRVQGQRGG